jgi:hypothetical protein
MTVDEYLDAFAEHLVHELRPALKIKQLTQNSVLLGAFTEAALRRLVNRMVHPMRVSTGAVIDYPMPVTLRQIDIIIWAPYPAPALFDIEGFGLVPRSSAFGVIEVKRSNHSKTVKELKGFLDDVDGRRIVSDPGGASADHGRSPGIGVLCVLEHTPSAKFQSMIDAGRVVAIFDQTGRNTQVRSRDVRVLVNFLYYVAWRYRVQGSQQGFPQLTT